MDATWQLPAVWFRTTKNTCDTLPAHVRNWKITKPREIVDKRRLHSFSKSVCLRNTFEIQQKQKTQNWKENIVRKKTHLSNANIKKHELKLSGFFPAQSIRRKTCSNIGQQWSIGRNFPLLRCSAATISFQIHSVPEARRDCDGWVALVVHRRLEENTVPEGDDPKCPKINNGGMEIASAALMLSSKRAFDWPYVKRIKSPFQRNASQSLRWT